MTQFLLSNKRITKLFLHFLLFRLANVMLISLIGWAGIQDHLHNGRNSILFSLFIHAVLKEHIKEFALRVKHFRKSYTFLGWCRHGVGSAIILIIRWIRSLRSLSNCWLWFHFMAFILLSVVKERITNAGRRAKVLHFKYFFFIYQRLK